MTAVLSEDDAKALHETLVKALAGRKSLGTIVKLVSLDPSLLKRKDSNGYTPLTRACESNPPLTFEVIQYLVLTCPKAVGMTCNNSKNTPLHLLCCCSPPLETVRVLIDYSLPTTPLQNYGNSTPLHHACYWKSFPEVIQFLAERQPITTLMFNNESKLPLDYAQGKSVAATAMDSLTRTMSEAACVLADICINTSVSRVKLDLPCRVVAHVAVTLSEFLSVDQCHGNYQAKFLPSPLEPQTVRAMVVNDHVKYFLRDIKVQTLLDGLIRMNRAGRSRNHLDHDHTDCRNNNDNNSERQKGVEILACVSSNVDCLFLYLREESPTFFQAPLLSVEAVHVFREHAHHLEE